MKGQQSRPGTLAVMPVKVQGRFGLFGWKDSFMLIEH